jgi:cysteinyl-tRNA synthetase
MNITNIDDKIIKRSRELNKSWKILTEEYEAEFWDDMDKLNVKSPDVKLRVTDKIPEILKFIEQIESKGLTTLANDGSVNFKTSAYSNYGKLNRVSDQEQLAEFALWKAAKENEPSWPSKWGPGRPGWHIECSTLASLIFGSHLDFHAGGIDLKFPHHENEEAQCCTFHGCSDWVQNWIHTGHLHLKGQSEKMSKSLKNTVSIGDFLKEYSVDQFRMACLLSHYRSSIEFGPELMVTADKILKRIHSFKANVRAYVDGTIPGCCIDEGQLLAQFTGCQRNIEDALSDDFHTAVCIGHLSDLMKSASKMLNNSDNKNTVTFTGTEKALLLAISNYIEDIFKMFGITDESSSNKSCHEYQMENLINSMINARNEIRLRAKEAKNKELFTVCDELRAALKHNQIEVKDHGNVSSWNKIK